MAASVAKSKKKDEKKKRKRNKKKADGKKEHEDECFRCGEGGELVMCDRTGCTKVYHLHCLKLSKPPHGILRGVIDPPFTVTVQLYIYMYTLMFLFKDKWNVPENNNFYINISIYS